MAHAFLKPFLWSNVIFMCILKGNYLNLFNKCSFPIIDPSGRGGKNVIVLGTFHCSVFQNSLQS
jgi:hypothetical protein